MVVPVMSTDERENINQKLFDMRPAVEQGCAKSRGEYKVLSYGTQRGAGAKVPKLVSFDNQLVKPF